MPAKSLMIIAALSIVGAAAPAAGQTPPETPVQRAQGSSAGVRPRIEINPRHLLYRRCVDRYVLQHRPSGTVLFPEIHCWWVRG